MTKQDCIEQLEYLVDSHTEKADNGKSTEVFVRNRAKARAYKNAIWLLSKVESI